MLVPLLASYLGSSSPMSKLIAALIIDEAASRAIAQSALAVAFAPPLLSMLERPAAASTATGDIRVMAAVASSLVTMRTLPAKLTPLIKAVMNSVKVCHCVRLFAELAVRSQCRAARAISASPRPLRPPLQLARCPARVESSR